MVEKLISSGSVVAAQAQQRQAVQRGDRGRKRLLAVGGEDDLFGLRSKILAREIGGGGIARAPGAGRGGDAQRGLDQQVHALLRPDPPEAADQHRVGVKAKVAAQRRPVPAGHGGEQPREAAADDAKAYAAFAERALGVAKKIDE